MKSITLKGLERESVGKSSTKALRNAGLVPCVIYGGDNATHFSVDHKQLKPLVYTAEAHTVQIELNSGKKFQAAMQDLQFHPVTDTLIHLDFVELFPDKEIIMEVPVKVIGNSKGVRAGGILTVNVRKLPVKALPANLPDDIEVDVTELEIGGKSFAGTLSTDKYKVIAPDNLIVATVRISRTAIKAAQDAAKAETTAAKKK